MPRHRLCAFALLHISSILILHAQDHAASATAIPLRVPTLNHIINVNMQPGATLSEQLTNALNACNVTIVGNNTFSGCELDLENVPGVAPAVLPKGIVIPSMPYAPVIIDGHGAQILATGCDVAFNLPGAQLQNLTIKNLNIIGSPCGLGGIRLGPGANFHLQNVTVLNFTGTAVTGNTAAGSNKVTLTAVPKAGANIVGEVLAGKGLPVNDRITAVSETTLTLEAAATATVSTTALTIGAYGIQFSGTDASDAKELVLAGNFDGIETVKSPLTGYPPNALTLDTIHAYGNTHIALNFIPLGSSNAIQNITCDPQALSAVTQCIWTSGQSGQGNMIHNVYVEGILSARPFYGSEFHNYFGDIDGFHAYLTGAQATMLVDGGGMGTIRSLFTGGNEPYLFRVGGCHTFSIENATAFGRPYIDPESICNPGVAVTNPMGFTGGLDKTDTVDRGHGAGPDVFMPSYPNYGRGYTFPRFWLAPNPSKIVPDGGYVLRCENSKRLLTFDGSGGDLNGRSFIDCATQAWNGAVNGAVNGVALSKAGSARNFLDETGKYSEPAAASCGGHVTTANIVFGKGAGASAPRAVSVSGRDCAYHLTFTSTSVGSAAASLWSLTYPDGEQGGVTGEGLMCAVMLGPKSSVENTAPVMASFTKSIQSYVEAKQQAAGVVHDYYVTCR